MEILWATCTDEELAQCRAAFIAVVSPEEASWTLELMLLSSTDDELVQVLNGVRASMPPGAFDGWVGQAEHSMSREAFARLRATLEISTPVGSLH